MATYTKFDQFAKDILEGKHNFSTHSFRVMLTNSPPSSTDEIKADITEIAAGSGYTAGGPTTTITLTLVGATAKASGTGVTFTATAGTIGPFRYAVLYNDTQTTPLKPLVSWWDYGESITLLDQEQFIVSFDAVDGIFQLS